MLLLSQMVGESASRAIRLLKFCAFLGLYGLPGSAQDTIRVKLPHQVVDQGSLGVCTLMSSGVLYESMIQKPISRDGLLAWTLRGIVLESVQGWGGTHKLAPRLKEVQAKGDARLLIQGLLENRLRNGPREYLELLKYQLPLVDDWRGPSFVGMSEDDILLGLQKVLSNLDAGPAEGTHQDQWAERVDDAFQKAFGSHPQDWGPQVRIRNVPQFETAILKDPHPKFLRQLISSVLSDRPAVGSLDMSRVRLLQGQAYLLPRRASTPSEPHTIAIVGFDFEGSEITGLWLRNSWGRDKHMASGDFRISWYDFWQVNMGHFTFFSDGFQGIPLSKIETLRSLLRTRSRSSSPVELLAGSWELDSFEAAEILGDLKRTVDLTSWAQFVSKQSSEWRSQLVQTGYLYDEQEFRRLRTLLVASGQDPRAFFERALGSEFDTWAEVMHRHIKTPVCPVAPFLRLVR